jgi:hypothetical protein
MTVRGRRALVVAAGATFALAATWPVSLAGAALYWGDVLLYFLPATEFLRRELLAGRIPLWNPYVLCGQPFVGNPQASVFYPTTALLPMMSATGFLALNAALHVGIAWAGAYRYLRGLGCSRTAAVLGGCTFAGSSAFLSRLQFPTMVQAIAWLPWLIHRSSRMGHQGRTARAGAFGAVVMLSLLAGHPQVAYMGMAFAVIGFAFRLRGRLRAERVMLAGRWCASVAMGGLLASVWWAPVWEMARLSSRSDLPLLKADRFAVEWQHLISLVWPGYVGDPSAGAHWAPGNMWEPSLYAGVVQLALAAYAVGGWRASQPVRFLIGMSLGSLWLALGVWGGLYAVVYQIVPGMGAFHDPARFGIPVALGTAGLAAAGLDRLRGSWASPGCRLGLTVAAAGSLLLWTSRLTPTVHASDLRYRPRLLTVGSHQRVYTALRQEAWDRYVNYAEYGPESGRYVHELTDTVSPNIGMRFGIREAGGYEPVPVAWSTHWEGVLREAIGRQSPSVGMLARASDIGVVSLPVGLTARHPSIRPLAGRPAIGSVTGSQAAWVVERVRPVRSTARALAALTSPGFDPTKVAIVNRPIGVRSDYAHPRISGRPAHSVSWSWGTNGGSGRVTQLRATSLLVVSSTAMPGWRVAVDGHPRQPLRANGAHLGVVVPAGDHTVTARYEPTAVRVGAYGTLVGVLLAMMAAMRRIACGERGAVRR